MSTIDILTLKNQFSTIINAVEKGHEFIICDKGIPIARLLPIAKNNVRRKPGAMKGKIRIADDFNDSIETITSAFNGDS